MEVACQPFNEGIVLKVVRMHRRDAATSFDTRLSSSLVILLIVLSMHFRKLFLLSQLQPFSLLTWYIHVGIVHTIVHILFCIMQVGWQTHCCKHRLWFFYCKTHTLYTQVYVFSKYHNKCKQTITLLFLTLSLIAI